MKKDTVNYCWIFEMTLREYERNWNRVRSRTVTERSPPWHGQNNKKKDKISEKNG